MCKLSTIDHSLVPAEPNGGFHSESTIDHPAEPNGGFQSESTIDHPADLMEVFIQMPY